jgi:hypothetical protein
MTLRSCVRATLFGAGLALAAPAFAGGYVLDIGGKQTELDLDQDTAVTLPDGRSVTARLTRKAEQTFRDRGLSFDHPASVQPSGTDVDKRVRQIMMVSANGNGVLVQRYDGLDPTALVDLMVGEMTDEEVAAGYQRKISPASRTLSDGTELKGKLARTESAGESWDRYILAKGDSKGGYLVISMMEDDREAADVAMLQKFWKTLKLDLPR